LRVPTYPDLKMFFHETYGQHLTAMALRSTSRHNGYAIQNMYNMLEGNNNNDKDMVTTITQTAAATTTTGTTPQVGPAVNADITSAITQVVVNQTAIMSQIVAMLFAQAPAQHTCQYVPHNTFQVPPIQQVAIPMLQHFPVGNFNTGHGGRRAVVEVVDVDGADGVVTHSQTTCELRGL
jgi:hypothetical protein